MSRPPRHQRGAAMILAIITLFICFTLGIAISTLTLHNLKGAKAIQNRTLAFNLAESGADKCIRALKTAGYPPAWTAATIMTPSSTPPSPTGVDFTSQPLAGGTYTVTIIPDANNSTNILKKYTIRAKGTVAGYAETVDVVVRQQSFGKYAYFTDQEVSSISGGAIWFFSGDKIRGPAHSNNRNNSAFQVDWTTSAAPIFEGQVTSAASAINYTPKSPAKEADFLKIYKTGSKGYQLQVDPIDLPTPDDTQKFAAWGGSTSPGTAAGVYTNAAGGIYIVGDSTIEAYVASGQDQGFKIKQGLNTWDIVVSVAGGWTSVKKNSGTKTTTYGTSKGVIYSTGDITDLSGEIADNIVSNGAISKRNAFTICTDTAHDKDITITDDLTYETRYDPSQSVNSTNNLTAGCLGLMAHDVNIGASAKNNLNIDALILAGSNTSSDGSFGVANYSTKGIAGSLKVTGGIIQKARGAVGTLSNGALSHGYAKDYYYDQRLADNPPPYFPTTGGYDKISWTRTANTSS